MQHANGNGYTEQHYSLEAEQAVLGAALIDPDTIVTLMEIIQPDDFFLAKHRTIYESMLDIADADDPLDVIILGDRLHRRKMLEEIGNVSYLTDLAKAVPTAANVEHYANIVREKAIQRQARSAIRKLGADEESNADELIANLQGTAEALSERKPKGKAFRMISDVAAVAFENLEVRYMNRQAGTGEVTGIPSGFPDLDRMTSGFQRSDLIIVAARPSVGKTAFALNIAQSAGIKTGETIAVFSLEMGAEQLVQRMICAEGNIDASRVRSGNMEGDDWEKVTMAIGRLAGANIMIDDSPSLTVAEIRSKCRKLKKEKGLGMILIDYLQLISGTGKQENRQQEVSQISRTLKQIARELNVPVIALSQLSRNVEQRQDKRPMMSDIRESGSIEQDADIVAFLYRDDYYDKESEKKNVIEIIIAKQRNGPTGTVELAFLKNYNKFVTLDRSHQDQAKEQPKSPPRKPPAGTPKRRTWGA
ncbi:replicative DNA helicase [Paenibacillus sp. S-38]|uniref:replicative DNA helicase n=1 Tax=Paenibacillus sp. S-38 TaxID=3416710 RepID=UPI003CF3589C